MATLSKTIQTKPISLQSVASGAVVISSVLDVSTVLAASFFIHFGRRATTALTVGCNIRIEASAVAAGEGHWYPVAVLVSQVSTSESEAITGTQAIGNTTLTVASTTNIAAGALVYFDNGTIANSEWHRVKSIVANTSITLEDAIVNAQTSSTLFTIAQFMNAFVDCASIKRLRVVVDNTGTGQAIAIEVECITCDSIA